MKFLTSLILILFSTSAFAGPGDGPIVPWPTNVIRETIHIDEIEGDWAAYASNSVWLIKIKQEDLEFGRSSIQIKSSALFTRQAAGWLYAGDRIFWGRLIMDSTHAAAFVIFKDQDGTKLRLAKGNGRYLDLKLYRTK